MNDSPLLLGLIGAGGIAQTYSQVLNGSASARVTAVCDNRRPAADAMAERLSCDSFDDYRQLLDRAECDAVLVCTPPSTHYEICLAAVKKSKHVLCEKPLSLDSASAEEMLDAAAAAGVILSMASKYRFVEDVIRAKSLLESGVLGKLVLMENTFSSRVEMSSRWNSEAEISGGGVLIDNGTHSIDLVRYLMGPLVEVLAVPATRVQALPVEDTVQLLARTESGVLATIHLSWSLNRNREHFIEIVGSRGEICVGWEASKYRLAGKTTWEALGDGYQKNEAFRRQIRHFRKTIRGEESLLVTAADALASVQVIEKAYRSLRTGRWTRIDGSVDETGA